MPAFLGNDNGTALKDPQERRKAYESYCQHIADGYPKEAWFYENGSSHCCWRTMDRYIEKNPVEFQSFLKDKSHSSSYKLWFERGKKLSLGEIKGNTSPHTWATIMRNMFHWDKEKKEASAVPEQFDATLNIIKPPVSS
jgi:hypothetical protein